MPQFSIRLDPVSPAGPPVFATTDESGHFTFGAITEQTADGGYIMGVSSTSIPSCVKTSPNNGAYDYWVMKVDAFGNQLWDRSID